MGRPFIRLCALSLPLTAGLAGCNQPAEAPAANVATANAAEAAPGDGYAERIRALPGNQRNGVFLRAIRDGKEQCQEVTDEHEIAPIEGKPTWAAVCDNTTPWVISIGADGTAIVTKASSASRLPPKAS